MDGNKRRKTRLLREDSVWLYRRYQRDHDTRRSRKLSAGSPAAMRTLAIRFARRSRELHRARTARTRPERKLRRVQDDQGGCFWIREFPAIEQGQDRSRAARRQDLRSL